MGHELPKVFMLAKGGRQTKVCDSKLGIYKLIREENRG
jgi:hypothetical protein